MKLEKMVRNVYPTLTPYTCQLADLPMEELKKALGKQEVIKLSFNENPLGPSPKAIAAMQKALLDLNYYPSSRGEAVMQRIAVKEGVQPGNVILSNGADDMILLVAQTFLEPEDEVIIPEITFVQYLASAHLMGAKPVLSPLKEDYSIDTQALLARITPKTKLIFLCNPNNPTGTIVSAQELKELLRQIPEEVLLVVDEAYHEYAAGGAGYRSAVEFVQQHKNVLVIRTFSKIYSLAAARIGYGIGHPGIIDAINHVRPPFNVNSIAQAGAFASLDDEEHVSESLRVNTEGKYMLYEAFEALGLKYVKSYGNFVFVDTGRDSNKLFDALAKRGIVVRILTGHGLSTSLRVSIGRPQDMKAFIEAFTEIIESE